MFGFYIMTEKGFKVLEGFLKKFPASDISYVVGDQDRTLENDFYDEIKSICIGNSIPFYNRKDEPLENSEYNFAISWRYMIKNMKNLVVFHDSILPNYRGFSPLINYLINGEKKIGVSALYASLKYDQGDIIFQESIEIDYPIKIREAFIKIIPIYEKLVIKIASTIKNGSVLTSKPQNEKEATYSLWRNNDDFIIKWNLSNVIIKRHVDALGMPYKGASTFNNGVLYRIHDVSIVPDVKIENRDPGKIIFITDGFPVVVCGKGLVKITDLRNNMGKSVLPFKKLKTRFTTKLYSRTAF